METEDVNLGELLACCQRELALRERVYPKWINKGWMSQAKADRELELMRKVCEFFVDAIFRLVTGQPPAPPVPRG